MEEPQTTQIESVVEEAAPQATAEPVSAPQQPDEEVYRHMDAGSVSMTVIPKSIAQELGLRAVFERDSTVSDIEEEQKKERKEPHIKSTATATYNLAYLLKFLKTADKVSSFVTLEMSTGEPIKCSAKSRDGKEIRFYLAPYIEE